MTLLRQLWLLGTIAILALVLAACGSDGAQDPQSTTVTAQSSTTVPDPKTTSTVETATTVSPPQTTSSTTTTDGQESGDETLKTGLQTEGTKVVADEFDKPISVTLDGNWVALEVHHGSVILEYTERVARYTRAVIISRSNPFAAETLDEWAAGQDLVAVENREETQVSGYEAVVYDLTYDGDGELPVLTTSCHLCGGRIILRNTEYYRIWMIDIDAERPLAIFSPVLRDDTAWLEIADAVVNSLQIG